MSSLRNSSSLNILKNGILKFIRLPAAISVCSSTLRNSSRLNISKNSILKFIRLPANKSCNRHNSKAIKFIARLRLFLCQHKLRKHKFKHSFQDLLNPISNCGLDIESSSRYLLHYLTYNWKILITIFYIWLNQFWLKTILFGSNLFDINTNRNILKATMSLVYLLKDLTNHFFSEFTDCFENEVDNKIEQICITRSSFSIYFHILAYFSYVLDNFFILFPKTISMFRYLVIVPFTFTRFVWFIYIKCIINNDVGGKGNVFSGNHRNNIKKQCNVLIFHK